MAIFITPPAPPPPIRSGPARAIDGTLVAFGLIPYALVALVLRIVVARAFFVAGQGMVAGPDIPLSLGGGDAMLILPAQVRPEMMGAFAAHFATVPLPSWFIAYGFAYAEFLLPICLLVGFATRLTALVLLIMTVVLQIYVNPGALWTTHAYWVSTLLVLMAFGGGAISLDRVVRHLYRA